MYLTPYGIWAVAGYRHAHAVLRDPKRFSSASGVGLANLLTDEYGWRKPSLILEVDPPVHTAHRALMVSTMNPKAMRAGAPTGWMSCRPARTMQRTASTCNG